MERRTVTAPELKAQIEAEREGRPFLVFRDGAGEQVIQQLAADAELWVGRGANSADVRLGWDADGGEFARRLARQEDQADRRAVPAVSSCRSPR
jgi:hypothetical protein